MKLRRPLQTPFRVDLRRVETPSQVSVKIPHAQFIQGHDRLIPARKELLGLVPVLLERFGERPRSSMTQRP